MHTTSSSSVEPVGRVPARIDTVARSARWTCIAAALAACGGAHAQSAPTMQPAVGTWTLGVEALAMWQKGSPTPPQLDRKQETALKLFIVMARSLNAVTAHVNADDMERHGITPTEFAILEALYHKGPLLLGEVQRKILVTSGGITYLVDRLVEKGLVKREQCAEDRRARYAVLTPAGQALIKKIFPAHAARIEQAMSGLTQAEQREVTTLLRKLGLAAAGLGPGDEEDDR